LALEEPSKIAQDLSEVESRKGKRKVEEATTTQQESSKKRSLGKYDRF